MSQHSVTYGASVESAGCSHIPHRSRQGGGAIDPGGWRQFAERPGLTIDGRRVDAEDAPSWMPSDISAAAPADDRLAGRAGRNQAGWNPGALQKWRLKRVLEYVDSHLATKITLRDLAAAAGLSQMHFAAQFRVVTGLRPHEYVLKRRIEYAKQLLRQPRSSLAEIALAVGFQTQAHFSTVFKRFAGNTPYQWRSEQLAQMFPGGSSELILS